MTIPRLGRLVLFGCFLLLVASLTGLSAPVKVKTVVDNAGLKSAPEIGAKSLVKLPLGTILEVLDKQGEWYKVSLDNEGQPLTGFIHEMLVEEAPESSGLEPEPEGSGTAAPDPAAEIEAGVETAKEAIRQEQNLAEAEEALDGLLAKVFRLDDPRRARSLAIEIYLWLGIGQVAGGDDARALREFKKMFDVDPVAAKEATRNIATPKIDALLKLAEQESLGLIVDFGLEVVSDPSAAEVFIDGRDAGPTPGTFHSPVPRFVLEVKKTGYVPVREEVFLTSPSAKRDYRLELLRRDLALASIPPGAAVSLDDRETGLRTDCRLEGLTFGSHSLRLTKDFYLDWTGTVEVGEAENPAVRAVLVGRSYSASGTWGERGSGLLDEPTALALDKEGFLYVVDESSDRVKRLGPDGRPDSTWRIQAPEIEDLKLATSAAFDPQANLYITDYRRNFILKVAPDGRSASRWTGEGGGTSEFRMPAGIDFDSRGNIYVVEAGNNRVKKYSAAGQFRKSWGSEGSADGQFILPRAIAVNERDEVYVLDKARVQKFSSEGEFQASWGGEGRGDGQFENPLGLAVDSAGCVYVADTENHRVQKFEAEGRLITAWGGKGREPGQMGYPLAVRVRTGGRVFVLERDNERVQVFTVGPPAQER
jgi:DNA-binding beta-propeller fold protein YncE